MKSLDPSEQAILNTICHYLTLSHIPYVHIRNTGAIIERNGRKIFVKPKFELIGASDLIVCYRGIPLAIEVKSRKGVLSTEQKEWLSKWQTRGGGQILVARSLDEVIQKIESLKPNLEKA